MDTNDIASSVPCPLVSIQMIEIYTEGCGGWGGGYGGGGECLLLLLVGCVFVVVVVLGVSQQNGHKCNVLFCSNELFFV